MLDLNQLVVRASSLPALADCAARWYAQQILGLSLPTSPEALLGKSIHHAAAAFDRARVNGAPMSADEAAGEAVTALKHPEEEIDWNASALNYRAAEEIAVSLSAAYCQRIATKYTYCAVELTCEPIDIVVDGVTVRLTGTADRIFERNGEKGVNDIKTGARITSKGRVNTKGNTLQVGGYQILAANTLREPLHLPPTLTGFNTSTYEVAVTELDNPSRALLGEGDQRGLLHAAANMAKTGDFPGNPSSFLCSKKYCAAYRRCIYRS